jgi:hypothetical protein
MLDRHEMAGFVRNAQIPNYSDGDGLVGINNRGELLVAPAVSPMAECVRQGRTWQCSIPTGSAFTHVAAWPTTRAELLLYNGEPSGGRSYVIESAWAANVATSIAAASAYTLLGQVVASGATPTDNTACLITSRAGKGAYTGLAKKAIANTSYGIASQWEVLAAAPAGPAASIGLAVIADIKGGIILPPGSLLLLNLIVGTATGTACIGVVWSEVQLSLG